MLKRILHFAYGLAAYALFLGTFLYALAFVGGCPLIANRLDGPLIGSLGFRDRGQLRPARASSRSSTA